MEDDCGGWKVYMVRWATVMSSIRQLLRMETVPVACTVVLALRNLLRSRSMAVGGTSYRVPASMC